MNRTLGKVTLFQGGKYYYVLVDHDETPELFWRLKTVCYKLYFGQRLRFRGPNLGKAEFLTDDGRLVILEPKTAFRIIGSPNL